MIESLDEQFDHIVLDAPPILGFADSVILATSVDGTILVVQGGKTPKETLQRAKDVLSQVNARILGVVINRVNIRRSGYDGYGYYYYRYHSYYGEKSKPEELPHIKKESVST
jgi:Mrp family chromosome partitioning ATPase